MATYRKKQMEPILTKFGIDPEKNKDFQEIAGMFEAQPNYQEWAVKMYFQKAITKNMLKAVLDFITRFSSQIKNLEYKNIVSYSNKEKIQQLLVEMRGIAMISYIKTQFEKFNTEQKKLLMNKLCPSSLTPLKAGNSSEVKRMVDELKNIDELPSKRKQQFWSNCSLIKTADALWNAIRETTQGKYLWDKEDLLYFLSHTKETKDCKVVVDNGDVVVVQVPTWDASRILGGNGRTQWCICTEERYFKQYVTEPRDNTQYFLFDFSKSEYEELAHIGFTVRKGYGICNAFSCTDKDILSGSIQYKNQSYNIGKALAAAKVKMGSFMDLKSAPYSWNIDSLVEYANKNKGNMAIVCIKNNVVAINALNKSGLQQLVGHTFVKLDRINVSDSTKLFVIFDFNTTQEDDNSICVAVYGVDAYGTYSETNGYNIFGADTKIEDVVNEMGIETCDYLKMDEIDPNVLMHKYIDTNQEDKAIEHINANKDKIDVNFKFNERPPVFSAISNCQFKVFERLVSDERFDFNAHDGFGESLIEALVFQLGMCDNNEEGKKEKEFFTKCIENILNSKFDVNSVDMNEDTILNISCEDESMLWITKRLVAMAETDVNRKNFFKCSPLLSAITNKNIEAIKLLVARPDIVIDKEDVQTAREQGLNIADIFAEKAALAK